MLAQIQKPKETTPIDKYEQSPPGKILSHLLDVKAKLVSLCLTSVGKLVDLWPVSQQLHKSHPSNASNASPISPVASLLLGH